MRIWIVEDELAASKRISSLILGVIDGASIEQIIDNVSDLKKCLQNKQHPDLIFSDIQLADGISIPCYQLFPPQCPIVFTTAYDHYAVEVFKLNSIHYLLKPLDKNGIEEAYTKFKKAGTHFNSNLNNLFELLQAKPRPYKDHFLFKSGTRLYPVVATKIVFFYSKEKLVEAFIEDGKRLATTFSLDELESEIDPKQFFRVNRQYIINRNFLDKVNLSFNGKLKLELTIKAPEEIMISREKAPIFKKWIGE